MSNKNIRDVIGCLKNYSKARNELIESLMYAIRSNELEFLNDDEFIRFSEKTENSSAMDLLKKSFDFFKNKKEFTKRLQDYFYTIDAYKKCLDNDYYREGYNKGYTGARGVYSDDLYKK